MKSVKKTFELSPTGKLSIDCIRNYVEAFSSHFLSHRYDNSETAKNYILGLLKCPKGEANMERMEEEIEESEYRAYQQFISNSNWDSKGLQKSVALETSKLLENHKLQSRISEGKDLPTGYIVDESAHLKKGKMSVGVSRQYAGVIGKVDNCQVGVYASLVNEKYATIINERLFLAKSWTTDVERCRKVGISEAAINYKTKPELALDMVKQDIARGVKFDWVGGDGLYGHNTQFCTGLDDMGQFYVLDVHKDEQIYRQEPIFSVPKRKSKRGAKPRKLKPDKKAIRLDKLMGQIKSEEWKLEEIRNTVKGKLKLWVYKTTVWSWDGKEEKARERTLIITKTTEKKPKVKYNLSNGDLHEYTHKEYAYFVSQRYWVERTFDNAKNELGMSDYQARKWKSWHNHHSLLMLASLFIMKQALENHPQVPLLSFKDARILIILYVFANEEETKSKLKHMKKRHKKRKQDIDFNYKKQKIVLKI